MVYVEPLDLYTIFVQYFAGSITIFFILAVIVFGYFASKFRMNNAVFLILMALFVVMMAGLVNIGKGLDMFYGMVILLVAIFIGYGIYKLIKQ